MITRYGCIFARRVRVAAVFEAGVASRVTDQLQRVRLLLHMGRSLPVHAPPPAHGTQSFWPAAGAVEPSKVSQLGPRSSSLTRSVRGQGP